VRNLQRRIFRATQQQDWRKVKRLTRFLLGCYSNHLISIRQVTQLNEGRKTPGVDGEVILTDEARLRLAQQIRGFRIWQAKPVRRIYIPKAKGGKRPLGIPTIKDRVLQCVVKNAYEPRFEAEFEANSYGFRPGRSTWDAIVAVHTALNRGVGGNYQYILDADIKGAFDHIRHEFILQRIGTMPAHCVVNQWLKAGYVEFGQLHASEEGTPQGGVISPLLANIALDGLEAHLGKGYRFVRYADDFVVMARTKEALEMVRPRIEEFLAKRGLELNPEKTRIVHKTDGFDFLGFHIQDFKGRVLATPQKEKVLGFLRRMRTWLKQNIHASPEAVIRTLNPILQGWAIYYSIGAAKQTFTKVQYELIKALLRRWTKRRHPNKSWTWRKHRYFATAGNDQWRFFADIRTRRGKKARLYLVNVAETPIIRHPKVKGTISPFDPTLKHYWETRMAQFTVRRLLRRPRERAIAKAQQWRCWSCGEWLGDGRRLEFHHLTPLSKGGTDEPANLRWVHQTCHWTLNRQSNELRHTA
jgi:RNA-directed DNA polymerase